MLDLLANIAAETATVLYEGGLYILIGFFVAGLLHVFLPTETIARYLGTERPKSVFLAALFGAPIPLCSCGVLPAAAALRAKGAGKSSTLSFLISTPETGVDSIALTYGLLGPVMAVVRPVVAVLTGAVAGLISIALPPDPEEDAKTLAATAEADFDTHDHAGHDHAGHDHGPADESGSKIRRVLQYGFGTLLDEIAFWLVVGVLLTGVLSALLPDDFFASTLGWDSGILPMLAMVFAGVPLYLCASASTPVAAALIAKGLSPGAALVFLLVGPATNAATMTVVAKLLGARRLRIYLGSIVLVSIAAGLLVDAVAIDAMRATALDAMTETDTPLMRWLKLGAAVVFVALLASSLSRTGISAGMSDLRGQLSRLGPALRSIEWRRLLTPQTIGAAAFGLLLLAAPSFFLVVGPGEVGVTQSLGKIAHADLGPGVHFKLPAPLGRGRAIDASFTRVATVGFRTTSDGRRMSMSDQAYYLTADENIIDIRAQVEYRISDPVRFAFGVDDPEGLVAVTARRELVLLVGGKGIDNLYTIERGPIENTLLVAIGARVERADIGCEVLSVRLLDVHAPSDVHDAFRDVASAIEDRDRDIHDAAGYAAQTAASTVGDVDAVTAQAQSERLASIVAADASGTTFRELAGVHEGAPWVTEQRLYLETLDRALAKPRKIINGAAGGSDVDLWVGGEGLTDMLGLSDDSFIDALDNDDAGGNDDGGAR